MRIPMVDLRSQYNRLKGEIDETISDVLESCQFIMGPNVHAFEEEVASYLGVKHAIGCASGTDALYLAIKGCGLEPGDEVITTPHTFIATGEAICAAGANAVFTDICADTYNLDPERIEAAITPATRAILPVHLYGHPAEMEQIGRICAARGLVLIEDCAQAFGAEYSGRKVGGIGDAGALSFFPSKNLGGYGDGGMVVTNRQDVADRVRMLRNHGAEKKYYHKIVGVNSRLDEIQAAILRVKLRHVEEMNARRIEAAGVYDGILGPMGVGTPKISGPVTHVYHQYTIRLADRDRAQKCLGEAGVGNAIYYPVPLHLQEVFAELGGREGDLPVTEKASREVLSLPICPEIDGGTIEEVCSILQKAL